MKKLLFLLIFLGVALVRAIPNPAPVYCGEMNYTANETHCIFPDGESCELWSFYNGSCGEEYVKELPCAELGKSLTPGKECCEGLVSVSVKVEPDENGICNTLAGAWSICLACGDDICDDNFESICNCPEDCENVTGCPEDAKICPDGSIVERIPPDCEFAPCPDEIICEDKCGDGICQEIVCQAVGCPCAETSENCPEDCISDDKEQKGFFKLGWVWFLIIGAVLIYLAIKVAKLIFWILAIIAVILALVFLFFW